MPDTFTLKMQPAPKPRPRRKVPCDERCIMARGDDCNCKCNGAHHGEGWRDDKTADLFTIAEG